MNKPPVRSKSDSFSASTEQTEALTKKVIARYTAQVALATASETATAEKKRTDLAVAARRKMLNRMDRKIEASEDPEEIRALRRELEVLAGVLPALRRADRVAREALEETAVMAMLNTDAIAVLEQELHTMNERQARVERDLARVSLAGMGRDVRLDHLEAKMRPPASSAPSASPPPSAAPAHPASLAASASAPPTAPLILPSSPPPASPGPLTPPAPRAPSISSATPMSAVQQQRAKVEKMQEKMAARAARQATPAGSARPAHPASTPASTRTPDATRTPGRKMIDKGRRLAKVASTKLRACASSARSSPLAAALFGRPRSASPLGTPPFPTASDDDDSSSSLL
ncbi:hypothetical protein TeGR_g6286, partial [Tetraparma gracilis]